MLKTRGSVSTRRSDRFSIAGLELGNMASTAHAVERPAHITPLTLAPLQPDVCHPHLSHHHTQTC